LNDLLIVKDLATSSWRVANRKLTMGAAQFSWFNGAAFEHPKKFADVCNLVFAHEEYAAELSAVEQTKVLDYFDFRIHEAISTLAEAESATMN
jgi:hypothetical protein